MPNNNRQQQQSEAVISTANMTPLFKLADGEVLVTGHVQRTKDHQGRDVMVMVFPWVADRLSSGKDGKERKPLPVSGTGRVRLPTGEVLSISANAVAKTDK